MESLPQFGTEVFTTLAPTVQIYRRLLFRNADKIHASHRQEFAYGTHPRQKLDVYPAHDVDGARRGSGTSTIYGAGEQPSPPPLLVFIYGGGFFRGAKRFHHSPEDLIYANLGHFFASQGFTTVIADYRLAKLSRASNHNSNTSGKEDAYSAKYPDGGRDVASVVEWVRGNLTDRGQPRDLFLMAASAGAAHLATFMLHPLFQDTRDAVSPNNCAATVRLRGVVYVSGFLDMNPDLITGGGVSAYYGPDQRDWVANGPVGLLRQAAAARRRRSLRLAFKYRLQGAPPPPKTPTLALVSDMDPAIILDANTMFASAWSESKLGPLERQVIRDHNHFSAILGLGTGITEEEAWGKNVIEWMHELCDRSTKLRLSMHTLPVSANDSVLSLDKIPASAEFRELGY